MDTFLLQAFLYLNIFLIGGLVAVGIQHVYAHYRQPKETPKPAVALPSSTRDRLLVNATKRFETALDHSAHDLEGDLGDTSKQLNVLLKRFGSNILDDEMKLFREHLEEIREKTEKTVGGAALEVATQQSSMEAKLAARQAEFDAKLLELQTELERTLVSRQTELDSVLSDRKAKLLTTMEEQVTAEQRRLLQQIDTKLADAVGSFLSETLEHNVDLGAQSSYLVALLEEHKEDFKKQVVDDETAA